MWHAPEQQKQHEFFVELQLTAGASSSLAAARRQVQMRSKQTRQKWNVGSLSQTSHRNSQSVSYRGRGHRPASPCSKLPITKPPQSLILKRNITDPMALARSREVHKSKCMDAPLKLAITIARYRHYCRNHRHGRATTACGGLVRQSEELAVSTSDNARAGGSI